MTNSVTDYFYEAGNSRHFLPPVEEYDKYVFISKALLSRSPDLRLEPNKTFSIFPISGSLGASRISVGDKLLLCSYDVSINQSGGVVLIFHVFKQIIRAIEVESDKSADRPVVEIVQDHVSVITMTTVDYHPTALIFWDKDVEYRYMAVLEFIVKTLNVCFESLFVGFSTFSIVNRSIRGFVCPEFVIRYWDFYLVRFCDSLKSLMRSVTKSKPSMLKVDELIQMSAFPLHGFSTGGLSMHDFAYRIFSGVRSSESLMKDGMCYCDIKAHPETIFKYNKIGYMWGALILYDKGLNSSPLDELFVKGILLLGIKSISKRKFQSISLSKCMHILKELGVLPMDEIHEIFNRALSLSLSHEDCLLLQEIFHELEIDVNALASEGGAVDLSRQVELFIENKFFGVLRAIYEVSVGVLDFFESCGQNVMDLWSDYMVHSFCQRCYDLVHIKCENLFSSSVSSSKLHFVYALISQSASQSHSKRSNKWEPSEILLFRRDCSTENSCAVYSKYTYSDGSLGIYLQVFQDENRLRHGSSVLDVKYLDGKIVLLKADPNEQDKLIDDLFREMFFLYGRFQSKVNNTRMSITIKTFPSFLVHFCESYIMEIGEELRYCVEKGLPFESFADVLSIKFVDPVSMESEKSDALIIRFFNELIRGLFDPRARRIISCDQKNRFVISQNKDIFSNNLSEDEIKVYKGLGNILGAILLRKFGNLCIGPYLEPFTLFGLFAWRYEDLEKSNYGEFASEKPLLWVLKKIESYTNLVDYVKLFSELDVAEEAPDSDRIPSCVPAQSIDKFAVDELFKYLEPLYEMAVGIMEVFPPKDRKEAWNKEVVSIDPSILVGRIAKNHIWA